MLETLAHGLLAVAPLACAAGDPLRCAVEDVSATSPALDALQAVLDRLGAPLGVPRLRAVAGDEDLWSAELAISEHLGLATVVGEAERLAALPSEAVERAVARATGTALVSRTLYRDDGTVLRCYAEGDDRRPVVVLVSACGMPVGLVASWIHHLATSFRAVTWESRDLFDQDGDFDGKGYGLDIQVGDLLAVLEGYDIRDAHLMGLCGGAAIALGAAASSRVSSMSLWHGDFELGPDAPKTQHQRDVHALLMMAGRSRRSAAGLHQLFRKPSTLAKMPMHLAPYLLYPYASPELLYRYGRLNGAIMSTDCRPLLAGARKPTLVVTSEDDATAHPQGSVYAAVHLERGRLEVLPHGDHLAAFEAGPERRLLASSFIDEFAGRASA